jgi:hypothetical protein
MVETTEKSDLSVIFPGKLYFLTSWIDVFSYCLFLNTIFVFCCQTLSNYSY